MSTVEFLQPSKWHGQYEVSDGLIRQISYNMQLFRFNNHQILLHEQDELTGIYLIRTGCVNLKLRSSLYDEYVIQRLYAGCSYGTYSFFAGKESKGRKSRFTMIAGTAGEYFFIPYE